MTEPEDESVAHWVGPQVGIGSIYRQRCMWCGALVDEKDLASIGIMLEPGDPPGGLDPQTMLKRLGFWEPGSFVAIDKGSHMWSAVEDAPDGGTPENSCCRLDPTVTA